MYEDGRKTGGYEDCIEIVDIAELIVEALDVSTESVRIIYPIMRAKLGGGGILSIALLAVGGFWTIARYSLASELYSEFIVTTGFVMVCLIILALLGMKFSDRRSSHYW